MKVLQDCCQSVLFQLTRPFLLVTPKQGVLPKLGLFDIQRVLSAIFAPISTVVTLYLALKPCLCALWEPAALSALQFYPQPVAFIVIDVSRQPHDP